MKNVILIMVFAGLSQSQSWGRSVELPVQLVKTSESLNSVDLDGDQLPEIEYQVLLFRTIPDRESYGAEYSIVPNLTTRLLRSNLRQIQFASGQPIGESNPEYSVTYPSAPLKHYELAVGAFSQDLFITTWFYRDLSDTLVHPFYTNQTECLVGFRTDLRDGRHYGWMYFSRTNTAFTTPFVLQAFDWHPIPGASIGAAEPPYIPMTARVVEDGGGHAVLRVSWNPAVYNWIFETSPDLKTPVTWTAYPSNSTYAEIPLTGDDPIRYFRLRRP